MNMTNETDAKAAGDEQNPCSLDGSGASVAGVATLADGEIQSQSCAVSEPQNPKAHKRSAEALAVSGQARSKSRIPQLRIPTIEQALSGVQEIDGVPTPHLPREFCEHYGSILYFVQSDKTGLLKIGITMSIRQRLAGLRREDGGRIRLVTWRLGDRNEEMRLHGRFIDLRVRGEWFHPAPRLVAYVKKVHAELMRRYWWASPRSLRVVRTNTSLALPVSR